jgi:hypothetical protein
MKKTLLIVFLFLLIFSACSNTTEGNLSGGKSGGSGGGAGEGNSSGSDPVSTPMLKSQIEDCLSGDTHPIAKSIADQYSDITSYDEVIGWFCNGALFEDILNALATEELSSADAGDILVLVAQGETWDEIWLELGVTKE